MSMFSNKKMYSGETANQMVQHMVMTYKEQIRRLKDEKIKLLQENQSIRSEVVDLVETISQLNKKLKNCNVAFLESRIKQLEDSNSALHLDNECLRDNNNHLMKIIDSISKNRKESRESPWEIKLPISSYDLNFDTEIRIDYCRLPDGSEYIDARKYIEGHPTKKGICLSLLDFDTFLRYGRAAWSRVTSGLFNKQNGGNRSCRRDTYR